MAARNNKKKESTSKKAKGFNSKKQQPDNTFKVTQESTSNSRKETEATLPIPTPTTTTPTTTSSVEEALTAETIAVNNHNVESTINSEELDKKHVSINITSNITDNVTKELEPTKTKLTTVTDLPTTPLGPTSTPIAASTKPTREEYSELITLEPDQEETEQEELLPKVVPPSSSPSTKIEMNPTRDESKDAQIIINGNDNNLQEQLISNVTKLNTANGAEVYLVGTAHFSTKSVEDVRQIIRQIKPNAVVLELCEERAFMLQLDEESLLEQNRSLSFDKIRGAIREKGLAQGLIYIMFVKMSANLTEKLGMAPGSEFRAGSNEALKIPGCSIILGDRSLKVTVARAVASISLWQKVKLVYQVLLSDVSITQEDVEKCKDQDILEQMLKELGGEFPGFKRVLLDERNVYLAHSIYKWSQNCNSSLVTSQNSSRQQPAKIVAIVGCGHVSGIVENWGLSSDDEVKKLNEIPKSSRTRRVVTKTIKYCSLALLLYVGYRAIIPSSVQAAIHEKIVG